MSIVNKKVKEYKRALIRHYSIFVNKGWITPEELEFMVDGTIVQDVTHPRTRHLFVEDENA